MTEPESLEQRICREAGQDAEPPAGPGEQEADPDFADEHRRTATDPTDDGEPESPRGHDGLEPTARPV